MSDLDFSVQTGRAAVRRLGSGRSPHRELLVRLCLLLAMCVELDAQTAPTITLSDQSTITAGSAIGVAVDRAGDVYVAQGRNGVRKFPAGCTATSCSQIVPLTGLTSPNVVAVDRVGNLFVADSYLFSSNTSAVEIPAGCTSTACQTTIATGLSLPSGLSTDPRGNVYIADTEHSRVVVAPFNCYQSCQHTVGTNLNLPIAVAADASQNVFIVDQLKTSPITFNLVTVPSGCGTASCQTAISLGTNQAQSIALDQQGNLFMAMASPAGILQVPPGCASSSCMLQLPSTTSSPFGITVDSLGTLYVSDQSTGNVAVRPLLFEDVGSANVGASAFYTLHYTMGQSTNMSPYPTVLTLGASNQDFSVVGSNCSGQIAPNTVCSVTINFIPRGPGLKTGVVQVRDSGQQILASTYVRGTGIAAAAAIDQANPVTLATGVGNTGAIVRDGDGNVFVADAANHRIAKVLANCTGNSCLATAVSGLGTPSGLAIDAEHNLYVSDAAAGTVVQIPSGCASSSCAIQLATLSLPYRVAVDPVGNVFVSTPMFGCGGPTACAVEIPKGCRSTGCQVPVGIGFLNPSSIFVDAQENIYLGDLSGRSVTKLFASGAPAQTINIYPHIPIDLALDAAGNLYVATDTDLLLFPPGCTDISCPVSITPLLGTNVGGITGIAIDPLGNLLLAGASNAQIVSVPRSQGAALTFLSTTVNTLSPDSPQTVVLRNAGNAPLNATAPGLAFNSPSFTQITGYGNDCTSSFSLTPGGACTMNMSFLPQSLGSLSGTVTLTDNSMNVASSQIITMQGNADARTVAILIQMETPSIVFTVDGVQYNSAAQFSWLQGSQHTVSVTSPQVTSTAGPGTQFSFVNWSDGNTNPTRQITTPLVGTNYFATFSTSYQLSTVASPVAGGTVSPASGTFYAANSVVNVTAIAAPGYVFSSWSPNVSNVNGASATINMTQPLTVTATFVPQIQVSVGTNQQGASFSVDGTNFTTTQTFSWAPGSTHTISAQSQSPNPGTQWAFSSWSDGGQASHQVTASAGTTSYTATLNLMYQLTTSANPADGGFVFPATGYFAANSSVSVSAAPSTGYLFSSWTGPVANPNTASTTISMTGPLSISASFVPAVQVTFGTSPAGASFTVDGSTFNRAQTYLLPVGSKHTIAVANTQTTGTGTQYSFANWSDGGAASHEITMAAGVTSYTANLSVAYQLTVIVNPSDAGSTNPASGSYLPANTPVPIIATAASNYVFGAWESGVADLKSASTTITLSGPSTVRVDFTPTAQVSVGTSVPGAAFSVDGTSYSDRQTFTWIVGSQHTLTAATQSPSPGAEYTFVNWQGLYYQNTIQASTSVPSYTANFTTRYQLTVNSTAGGTALPASGNYYLSGSTVALTANASNGYVFTGWTGPVADPTNPNTTVALNAPQTVKANFAQLVQVTVGTSPTGLSFIVDGTTYNGPQTLSWITGSNHTIATTATQSPSAGTQNTFNSWSDGGGLSHTVTAPAASAMYTANFATSYQLTMGVNLAAGGTVSPVSGTYYSSGSVVNLTATANPGYVFTGWTGPVAAPNSINTTITLNAPQTVIADFAPTMQVTVGSTQPGTSFTVDGTTYSAAATLTWIVGSSHTLATAPTQTVPGGTQYTFSAWSDGGAAAHQVTASTSITSFTVSFKTSYQLTLTASPSSAGTISPASGGYYLPGTVVNLTATASSGYVFSNWTGPVANAGNASTTVTVNAPVSVSANFVPTVQVVVGTSPSGLAFSVDGSPFTTSQTFTWVIGSKHAIAAAPQQMPSPGTRYDFANWSDSGLPAHSVTAVASGTSYLAAFTTSYQLVTSINPASGGSISPVSGAYYLSGTTAPLTAIPAPGYIFKTWTGAVASPVSASTSIVMNAPQSVAASFISALAYTSSVDFGTVYQGTATTQSIEITNRGTSSITMGGAAVASVTGGSVKEFAVNNQCPSSLSGGASCSIQVVFTAGAYYTPQSAALTLTDSAPDSPQSVTLNALVIDPQDTLGVTSINFSATKTNSTSTSSFKLKNTGGTTLAISNMDLTGANASSFSVSTTCGNTVAAGNSCTITVSFAPVISGKLSAALVISDNTQAGTQTVSLSGTAH